MTLTLIFSDVSFNLMMNHSSVCDETDSFREGVEFSFRNSTEGEWIPLMFFAVSQNIPTHQCIELPYEQPINENDQHIMLRGYTVPYIIQTGNNTEYSVSICVNDARVKLQFRWLNTAFHNNAINLTRDVVVLDDITIIAHNCTQSVTLLEDDFDDENQTSVE